MATLRSKPESECFVNKDSTDLYRSLSDKIAQITRTMDCLNDATDLSSDGGSNLTTTELRVLMDHAKHCCDLSEMFLQKVSFLHRTSIIKAPQ